MDPALRTLLDVIVHRAAEAEVAINTGDWGAASIAVLYTSEAARNLQIAINRKDPDLNPGPIPGPTL